MKRYTGKRADIQKQYLAALQDKLRDHDGRCDGCGAQVPLTPSHFIPRSFARDLIADPDNFGLHCEHCAATCERGDYPDLHDGEKIHAYISRTRPDYLAIKAMKYEERTGTPYPWGDDHAAA